MTAKEIIQYMESLHDEEQWRVLMGFFKTAPGVGPPVHQPRASFASLSVL